MSVRWESGLQRHCRTGVARELLEETALERTESRFLFYEDSLPLQGIGNYALVFRNGLGIQRYWNTGPADR